MICFESTKLYRIEEQQKVLIAIGQDGLKAIARFIEQTMGEESQQNDQYWKNRIKPFFISAWPKESKFLCSEISQSFALMSLSLDDEFENAVECIKTILTPFDIGWFLIKLKQTQHIEKHPLAVFDLLATVFDTNTERYSFVYELKEVITSLVTKCPEIKNDGRYVNIEQFLKRK